MIKITLNKANKISNLLESTVKSFQNTPYAVSYVSVSSIKSKLSAGEEVLRAKADNLKETERRKDFISKLYQLRQIIGTANRVNSIDVIINKIACLNTTLSAVTGADLSVNRYGQTYYDVGDFDQIRMSSQTIFNINLVVYSKEEVEALKEEREVLKKELRDTEELRNEMNHQTLIEIPSEMETFLKAQKLL